MPLILAGFGWLMTAIGALAKAFLALFAVWMTKRTLITAALVAAYGAIVVILFTGTSAVLASVTVSLPPGYAQAAGMWLPSNAYTCLSAVVTMTIVRWVYEQQVKILDYAAQS